MKVCAYLVLLCSVSLCSFNSVAQEDDATTTIEVTALLGKKAMLKINGQSVILEEGASSAEGIQLHSIKEEGVELIVDGETQYYPIGSTRIGSNYSVPDQTKVRVYKDTNGMFTTIGSINGFPVNFLVDTGATSIAMNIHEAKRLGINFLLKGKKTSVHTASGIANAWLVTLDEVGVGNIKLKNIEAAVLDGNSPGEVLLGMSFLGRLNVQHQGEVMLLETRF